MPPLGLLPMLGGISPPTLQGSTTLQCNAVGGATRHRRVKFHTCAWMENFRCTLTRQLRGGATLLTKLATSRGVCKGRGGEGGKREGGGGKRRPRGTGISTSALTADGEAGEGTSSSMGKRSAHGCTHRTHKRNEFCRPLRWAWTPGGEMSFLTAPLKEDNDQRGKAEVGKRRLPLLTAHLHAHKSITAKTPRP